MKASDVKLPAKRRRGRYSNEFKRELVNACEAPGVSTASVALANGVNANLLRRWVSEFRDIARNRRGIPADGSLSDRPEFIQLESEVREMTTPTSKVELVMQRGEFRVLVSGSPEFVTYFDKSLIRLEASMIYKTTNRVRVGDR